MRAISDLTLDKLILQRGVDAYPALLAELIRRGWSDVDVGKVAGGNILRVMGDTEKVAQKLAGTPPGTATLLAADCR